LRDEMFVYWEAKGKEGPGGIRGKGKIGVQQNVGGMLRGRQTNNKKVRESLCPKKKTGEKKCGVGKNFI